MVANNTLAVSNLDFTGIQQNLVNFLQNYPQFKDYNFEGSNLRTIIDLLAYNTYMNSFYTNMAINEMFIDTAVMRESIVSHAKELNYIPRSARSSEAYIDITMYPTGNPAFVTIPSGTPFQGSNGNNMYTFLTGQTTIINPNNGNYSVTTVPIFEGVLITETFTVDTTLTNQRFILSNPNIDTTSLTVSVTDAFGNSQPWNYFDSLLNVSTTTQAWFMQATGDNYEIMFGDGVAGIYPPNGSTITANYRACNMDAPNGITNFTAASSLGGYGTFIVSTSNDANGNPIPASGGSQPESNSSIQFNAPRSYQTLERAVTTDDYKNILYSQFPEIRAINVYGGESVSPPQYGKVFIAVDVNNAVGLSQLEMSKIQSFISTKTFVIQPMVIAPDYTFLAITTNITYDLNKSSLAASDIQGKVLSSISSYNSNNLINFDTLFRYSKLAATIDNTDTSILSSETDIRIFKIISPTTNTNYSAALRYQNALTPNSITSSSFTYDGLQCSLQDDANGNIEIISTSGNTVSTIAKTGTINYSTGEIDITNLDVTAFNGEGIAIFANTVNYDIQVSQNTIIEIDPTNTTVNATGVRG